MLMSLQRPVLGDVDEIGAISAQVQRLPPLGRTRFSRSVDDGRDERHTTLRAARALSVGGDVLAVGRPIATARCRHAAAGRIAEGCRASIV